jgi:putative heme utilization carrier protein HutX
MTDAATLVADETADPRARLAARLAANPDGVIESLAREHGVTTLEATRMLPAVNCRWAAAGAFADVMAEVTGWGEVLFIVHTPNLVLECAGRIPPGEFGRGYFNLHGDSPIGGHIKADRCAAIGFVRRPFMGRESCSIQFFDSDGDAMFKIFVRRTQDRSLDQAQVEMFDKLAARVSATH